jgi:hypothetical protein
MDFEVYCDESSLEALTKNNAHLFAAIGSIWIPTEKRIDLKNGINTIKEKYGIKGELKWQKFSPAYYGLYKDVIDFYFHSDFIRFRVILIESIKVDHVRFNHEDAELGFYKFYYQLLHHWIFDFNRYDIFLDLKTNRDKGRLKSLKKVLDQANLTSDIKQVQGLPSEQSVGIQLADFLTGLVAAKFNGELTSESKLMMIKYVEETYLNKPISATSKWEEKLNVFKINLQGGW